MSQNINIIYKVDKTQIESSNASVQKAKALTDQLAASAQKFSGQGSKGNIQFGNTIEGVRVRMQQLRGQIDLTNQSDKKRLDGLVKQYKEAQAQLDKYTSSLKTQTAATKEAANGANSLAGGFGNLYTALKAVVSAAIIKELGGMALEAAALAGKVEGVERAFNRAFPNSVLIINDLRKATKGTITDFELMQRTLQATNLGVSVEKLPELFEFATVRAQQTGESVEYLVDSIVRGIGRKSPLILDNLGISAVRLKEEFNGASIASQSVADVTAAVGRIVKEEMAKMGGYVETAATKVDRLSATWENLKVQISKLVTQDGGFVDLLTGYVTAFEALFEAQAKGISLSELLRKRHIDEVAQIGINILKQNEFTDSKEHNLKVSKEVIAEKTHELILLQKEEKALQDNVNTAKLARNESIFDTKTRLANIAAKQKDLDFNKSSRLVLIEQIKLLQGLAKSFEELAPAQERVSDSIETLESKVKDLNEQLIKTDNISTESGIKEARRIKNEITATELKIETIKDQIYWEDRLREKREKGKGFTETDTLKPGIADADFRALAPSANKSIQALSEDLVPLELGVIVPRDNFDKLEDELKDKRSEIESAVGDIIVDQAVSVMEKELAIYDQRINAAQTFYDHQIELVGNNDKAKKALEIRRNKEIAKLEKERGEKEKKNALTTILIQTAIGVAKAFGTYPYPASLVPAALVAVAGASQYAIASRANYKEGVIDLKGPGTTTSDSIPVNLSRRESVMTADETINSGKTLRMVRAGKLNDKIFERIMNQSKASGVAVGFDDTRLLAATKQVARAAAGNNIVNKAGVVYEAIEQGNNTKTYIRSKSLN